MRKFTTEEFIEKAKIINNDRYDYSKCIVTVLRNKVIIICKEHGEFQQRASAHLDGQGCMGCRLDNRKVGLINFLELCNKVHGNRYDYSLVTHYVNSNDKVKVICSNHGVFEITPHHHTNRKQGCSECKKVGLKGFITKSILKHGDKYDYSLVEYINNKSKVKIICIKHGIFNIRPNDHMNKGQGCSECMMETIRKSTDQFIKEANIKHCGIYNYDNVKFKTNKDKILIICKKHGDFRQTVNQHLCGQGCPKCNYSYGERMVSSFLIERKVKHLSQYKFDDCKYKNKLSFDFYIPDMNICIEYNGKQHYEPIEIFGGINAFESQVIKDNIKREYCKLNNILLIEIKYNQNIKKILNNYFLG